jgi:hypothetical protein
MMAAPDTVFGPLGGGQQHGDGEFSRIPEPPRNEWGIPTHNPSGSGGDVPRPDSVFGDLGGPGVAGQHGGGAVPPDPGQGGM